MSEQVEYCQCPACRKGPLHWSDCAVHNAPSEEPGPCDCGGFYPDESSTGTNEEKK